MMLSSYDHNVENWARGNPTYRTYQIIWFQRELESSMMLLQIEQKGLMHYH